jgi:hypothetical protein
MNGIKYIIDITWENLFFIETLKEHFKLMQPVYFPVCNACILHNVYHGNNKINRSVLKITLGWGEYKTLTFSMFSSLSVH